MDNAIEQAFAEILQSVVSAKNFLVSEIPDVVSQLIQWKIVESSAMVAISLFAIVVLIVNWILIVNVSKEWAENHDELASFWLGGSVVATVIGVVVCPAMVVIKTFELVQLWIAPKVWLLEYSKELFN